ncbi:MAG: hypothetical protein H7235_00060 [Bdellovibrionaceae bacterium]|nr:hypothetical protein [Pseudobdellovibrionaceae bacterium]
MAKKTKPKSKNEAKDKAKKLAKPAVKKAIKPLKPAKLVKPAPKATVKLVKAANKAAPAEPVHPVKVDHKAAKEVVVGKATAQQADKLVKAPAKTDVKQQAKPLTKSKIKAKKVEKKEDDFDDDMIDDDFGESEIAEYEDDLKAVEEEDEDLNEDLSDDDESEEKETEVYLTDSEGRRLCRVRDCDQVSNVEGYCRYHYLLLWKKIQIRKSILLDGKLEKYIEDLTTRYPDKFLEMIKKDMKSEKDFHSAIQELEIDESAMGDNEAADDDAQSFADEIRGVGEVPATDDDGDF